MEDFNDSNYDIYYDNEEVEDEEIEELKLLKEIAEQEEKDYHRTLQADMEVT